LRPKKNEQRGEEKTPDRWGGAGVQPMARSVDGTDRRPSERKRLKNFVASPKRAGLYYKGLEANGDYGREGSRGGRNVGEFQKGNTNGEKCFVIKPE